MSYTQASTLSLRNGHALSLPATGRLSVLSGRVWVTRKEDLDDHVLGGGESIDVDADEAAVVEAWGDAPARLRWTPDGLAARLVAAARVLAGRPATPAPHNVADDGIERARPRPVARTVGRGAAGAA